MEQFQLTANDWHAVSLLSAEHLSVETRYLEESLRWMAYHGLPFGIAKMDEKSLKVNSSDQDYEIVITHCRAFSPNGYPIHIAESLSHSNTNNSHSEGMVPIYLGVSVEKESLPHAPSYSRSLVEGSSLIRHYKLTTDREDSEYDWLLIGFLRKGGSRYILDEEYIPECLYLESHPQLIRMADSICHTARQALGLLQKFLSRDLGSRGWVQPYTGILANAIAPATVVINWRSSPRAYIERLTIVLEALRTEIYLIREDLAASHRQAWVQAHDLLESTLERIHRESRPNSDMDYGKVLSEIEKSLQAFIKMVEVLPQDKPRIVNTPPAEVGSHEPVTSLDAEKTSSSRPADEGRGKFTIGRR